MQATGRAGGRHTVMTTQHTPTHVCRRWGWELMVQVGGGWWSVGPTGGGARRRIRVHVHVFRVNGVTWGANAWWGLSGGAGTPCYIKHRGTSVHTIRSSLESFVL
uniref:Uncharacterized protein n=1 Tax=Cacopsylla melanoneura TaxID=428564 RepID=A0A8D9E4G6_9HEMI